MLVPRWVGREGNNITRAGMAGEAPAILHILGGEGRKTTMKWAQYVGVELWSVPPWGMTWAGSGVGDLGVKLAMATGHSLGFK